MSAFPQSRVALRSTSGTVRLYWIAIGLFTLLFVSSIALTFGDLEGSYASYARLGFPAWSVYFNGFAKIFGLVALLTNKSRTLKDFAFAGFLYDLLLALSAHSVLREPDVLLPLFGLVLWGFAFVMDRKVSLLQQNEPA